MNPSRKYVVQDVKHKKILYSSAKSLGFVPEKDSELFVSRIPPAATVYDLAKFFEKAGEIFQIRLMMQLDNLSNRGFGYVTFMNKAMAEGAHAKLKNKRFMGGPCLAMEQSIDNCRLFVGGMPVNKTKDEIWHELEANYRPAGLVDVITYRSYSTNAINRGFVFLEFQTHEGAAYFRAKYTDRLYLFGKLMLVDWSVPNKLPEDVDLSKVKIIFVRNLDVTESVDEFKHAITGLMSPSRIEKVYKFKNYAFIHLRTREDAEWLLSVLKRVYDGTVVEVSYANPQTKFNNPEFRQQILLKRRKCSPPKNNITSRFSGSQYTNSSFSSRSTCEGSSPSSCSPLAGLTFNKPVAWPTDYSQCSTSSTSNDNNFSLQSTLRYNQPPVWSQGSMSPSSNSDGRNSPFGCPYSSWFNSSPRSESYLSNSFGLRPSDFSTPFDEIQPYYSPSHIRAMFSDNELVEAPSRSQLASSARAVQASAENEELNAMARLESMINKLLTDDL